MKQAGNNKTSTISTKENVIEIIKGSVASVILTLIFLILFSLLLTYTNIPETAISPVVIIITAISILIRKFI